jgi:hypothetical protein
VYFDDNEHRPTPYAGPVAYTGFGSGANFKCSRHENVCE